MTARPIRTLLRKLAAARRRARDARLLRAMNDRELADLGIGRGEIPGVLLTSRQPRVSPALPSHAP